MLVCLYANMPQVYSSLTRIYKLQIALRLSTILEKQNIPVSIFLFFKHLANG